MGSNRSGFAQRFEFNNPRTVFRLLSVTRRIRKCRGIFGHRNPLTLTVHRQAIAPIFDGTSTALDCINRRAKPRAFEKFLSCKFTVILKFSSHLFLRGMDVQRN